MERTVTSPATGMHALLAQLDELNIKLHLDGEQLRINAPLGVLSPSLRSALALHRDALIAHLRQAASTVPVVEWPHITPDADARHEPFALSDVQHAYWIGRSRGLDLGGVATHYYYELDSEDLDLARFAAALQRLIDRHDMLRAVVHQDGRQQILHDLPPYAMPVEDLRTATPAARKARLQALRDEMSHQQRPADRWPLFDIRAVRTSDRQTRLFFSWDFINLDAWSLYAICREWNLLYADLAAELPPLALSYRDYVLAERALRASPAFARDHDYWWQRLDSLPPAPELPVVALSAGASPRFTRRRFRLGLPEWQVLKGKAQWMGITPSALLLAAYVEVLALWSKTAHFSLNMTLFSRLPLHEEVNRLVGDFTCLTLLEVDTARLPTFRERALALQRQFLRDFDHRLVSGVDVLREWAKRRGYGLRAAMPVVFTSCLVLNSAQGDDAGLVESFGRMVYGISQTPQVWLDNQVMEDRDGLVLNWDALEEVFAPGVLQAMFDAYGELIRALASSDQPWSCAQPLQLPPHQASQRELLNATAAPEFDRLLHQGIIEQALEQPHATAVVSGARTLSYAELLARASALADELVEGGVQPGELVAVVMPRGWCQVAAVLAILIAGAAYLPVDIDAPRARREQLFAQAQARVAVICSDTDRAAVPEGVKAVTLPLHTPWKPLPVPPALRQAPGDLAYVIFTSGSTGVPKGVMIDHRGAVNTVEHVNRLFRVTAADRTLMVSSLSFDLSVYDIFGLLGAGGCVVIPDDARNAEPEHWRELIAAHGVTLWNSAPPLMSMLLSHMEAFDERPLSSVRLALLSGDWIPLSHHTRMATALPNAHLVSLGGATEASIWSIYRPVDRVEPHWKSIPYGRPLPNQMVHVLNERLQPCPVHVTGHLYIGGIGLARGYLHDAQKTSAKFIQGPDGSRLYDTGDLGRVGPDGEIEFLGREDAQVKLRGHRIELGEIAAVLRTHPAVQEAIAVVDGDGRSGQQTLHAYLVLDPAHRDLLLRTVDGDAGIARVAPRAIAQAVADEERRRPLARLDDPTRELWQRLDALYTAALLQTFSCTSLAQPAHEVSATDLMRELGAAKRYERWMQRALHHLAAQGIVQRSAGSADHFVAPRFLPTSDLTALTRDVEARLQAVLGLTEREARWFTLGADTLQDVLSEATHSAELYTADETAAIYQKLFPDSHVQLRRALQALLELRPGGELRVLEVGAGLGSATQHLLPVLSGHCTRYDFTDVSPYFLKRAAERFAGVGFVHCGLLDLDRPPELQGYRPHDHDLVVASSVLHDVADIAGTLVHLRRLLRPGGTLLLLEETKFFPSFDLTMGLQQGFDVFRDGREHHPLLSRSQWRERLLCAGFASVEVLQVAGSVAEHVGFDVIVAQTTEPAQVLDEEALDRHLLERLPAAMKPNGYQVLPAFPTTANGKVDYRALARPLRAPAGTAVLRKPDNELEQQLLDIWREVLGQDAIGTTSSFFDIGGDSLLLVEVRNRLKLQLGLQVPTTVLFEHPTIAALARHLGDRGERDGDLARVGSRAARQRRALQQQRGTSQGAQEHV